MKAKDLMVGDRVFLFDDKPVKVDCIGNVEVYLSDENGIDWRVTYEHIKPIPLTPEILENCDFKKEYGAAWNLFRLTSTKWFVLYKKEFGYTLHIGESEVTLKYLHELQHCLKLCGINLEIKL